jgi:hypothetical protein
VHILIFAAERDTPVLGGRSAEYTSEHKHRLTGHKIPVRKIKRRVQLQANPAPHLTEWVELDCATLLIKTIEWRDTRLIVKHSAIALPVELIAVLVMTHTCRRYVSFLQSS